MEGVEPLSRARRTGRRDRDLLSKRRCFFFFFFSPLFFIHKPNAVPQFPDM